MNGRRGFLAFVGGASVAGVATTRASATTPTLILPPGLVPAVPASVTPLLDAQQSDVHALMWVAQMCPPAVYREWLEGGLRTARLYNGRTEAELERGLRIGLAAQAKAQRHETPEEARARVVRLVDQAATHWNGARAGR